MLYHLNRRKKCDENMCWFCSKIFDSSIELELHRVSTGCTSRTQNMYGSYSKSTIYEHVNLHTKETIIGFIQCSIPHSKGIPNNLIESTIITYISPNIHDIIDVKKGCSASRCFMEKDRDRELIMEILLDNSYFCEVPPPFVECVETEIKFVDGPEIMRIVLSYDNMTDRMTCIYIPIQGSKSFFDSGSVSKRLHSWM